MFYPTGGLKGSGIQGHYDKTNVATAELLSAGSNHLWIGFLPRQVATYSIPRGKSVRAKGNRWSGTTIGVSFHIGSYRRPTEA
ncbi:MAG: hypothetical protein EXS25_12055 [Pedosphaera sp.]|nr:hypothetical protein [Pedosphaera sp.]